MGYLRSVLSVTLRDKVCSCEIRTTLNVEPLLEIERSQLQCFGHVTRMPQEKIGEASPAGYTHGNATHWSSKDQVVRLHLRPCLVPSWWWARRTIKDCWKTWGILSPLRSASLSTLLIEEAGVKMNDWEVIKQG